ncbi:MAG: ABC transporter permease [Parasporobacterium sp.]|nr:ABC transporter permease [Parasporobacterium sp.]
MWRYIIKRILLVFVVILGVLIIIFILSEITPGNPAARLLGTEASMEEIEAKAESMGLNDPVIVQFGRYVFNFVTKLDLGQSYTTRQPVWGELMTRYPYTLTLGLLATALAILIGVPLGVLGAIKQYSVRDTVIVFLALVLMSIPNFWFGILCINTFSVKLKWLPPAGTGTWYHWIMPVVILSLGGMASLIRVTRSSMLDTIRMDYMRTARAKGQKESVVIIRHGFRNALIPVVNAISAQMSVVIGGTVMIESVFALPGIGKYMTDAVTALNWPAVRGGVICLAIAFSILNLIVDLIYVAIDPRLISRYNGVRGREIRKLKKEMAQARAAHAKEVNG